ncbi:MAG TPA: exosortase/archaeosortase family protein [Methylomirabilota bacterium]|nr:exosortase/archaeosortase family protein [Methylomirabilota bacterium]
MENIETRENSAAAAGTPPLKGAGTGWLPRDPALLRRCAGFVVFLAVVTLIFGRPLVELVRYALGTDLYSHIVLIPLMSLYLLWVRRSEPQPRAESSWRWAAGAGVAGGAMMLFSGWAATRGWDAGRNDVLSITTTAYLCFVVAGLFVFFGRKLVREHAFSVGLLVFMIPMPEVVTLGITRFFQYTSAEASYWLLVAAGTPVLRESALIFGLPGIVIEVAEECSGIRSSLVLFILSFLAGRLLLQSPWRRAVLVMAVIPLGVFRNALRIVTISLLCVHVDPIMINSAVHRRGGPVFFAVSLVPFFFLLWWLRRSETRRDHGKQT